MLAGALSSAVIHNSPYGISLSIGEREQQKRTLLGAGNIQPIPTIDLFQGRIFIIVLLEYE